MNAIRIAIDEIRYRIPRDILRAVFITPYQGYYAKAQSLDDCILNAVIRPRVMLSCDLVGGTEVTISLEGLTPQVTNRLESIFKIPKDRTQNRTITSALSFSYMSVASAQYATMESQWMRGSVSPSMVAGRAMMDAASPMPVPSTARVALIGENTVMIRESVAVGGFGWLRCILGNDEQMSNLQVRSIPDFCKLCELAVKSYIYNEYSIELDRGRVEGGFEIGKFKEIVEQYADAEAMYQEYLTTRWAKVAFANDRESYERHIRRMIGGYR